MDTTGEVFMSYGVNAFPTTFMITREGEVFGYASGQLNEATMKKHCRADHVRKERIGIINNKKNIYIFALL